jgi:hypothetical protein
MAYNKENADVYKLHPEINFLNEEFKFQKKINELFKLNIRRVLKEKKSKDFILFNNVFIYKN